LPITDRSRMSSDQYMCVLCESMDSRRTIVRSACRQLVS